MDRLDGIDWHPHGWRSPRSFRQSNRTKKKISGNNNDNDNNNSEGKKERKDFSFPFLFLLFFNIFRCLKRKRENSHQRHRSFNMNSLTSDRLFRDSGIARFRNEKKTKNNNKGGAWGGEGEIPSPEANYERKKEREIIPHSRSLTARNHLIVSINGRNGMMGRI